MNSLKISDRYSTNRSLKENKPEVNFSETTLFWKIDNDKLSTFGLRNQGVFKSTEEEKPLISIVTVVYNGENILEGTIKNILEQTYDNIELIIVDGNSSDRTIDIVKKYNNQIDYCISEKDNGIYDAMNKGISLATGDWINFMNAGDSFYSNDVLKRIFEKNIKENIVFGKSISYYKENQVLRFKDFNTENKDWYYTNMPNHQAIFINKNIYKTIKYNLEYKIFADTVYLREAFKNSYHEVDLIVSNFELGGKSNYYSTYKTYKQIVKDSIKLNGKYFKPIILHTIKFILQKVLGYDKYLKFYIKYMVKK